MHYLIFLLPALFLQVNPQIVLHSGNAVVWNSEQLVEGELEGFSAEKVMVYHNGKAFSVPVSGGEFSFSVKLLDKENAIWTEAAGHSSDTLNYTLGYKPAPEIVPAARVEGDLAFLEAEVVSNPTGVPLEFTWFAGATNPADTQIRMEEGPVVTIPGTPGNYYFNLLVKAAGDSTWFQTFVKREPDGLKTFDLEEDAPEWMESAIIYEITPASFVASGTFKDIQEKLPELHELGVNTLWLQPITETHNGWQGYDVTNYMSVNPKFGTEEELRRLITQAHSLGMRVLFDVVLNHTSIHHPYAKDRIRLGERSHYYDYYQHEDDGKPYSSHYNWDEYGFINYFWPELVNLNYNNPEVSRWMLEVVKYWVRDFDIDGYRFDAVWGINSRNPEFSEKLRRELKSIKPDLLLLAEDKGWDPQVYELGYDAAYDWTADTTWVSQWSWEYEYDERSSKTLFNHPEELKRDDLLEEALFSNPENMHRVLFKLQNNDLQGFTRAHSLEQTRMAAALLFSLPGIPMIYNGQEIGYAGHPYGAKAFFQRGKSIQSLDSTGLFQYYQKLIGLHKKYQALSGSTAITKVPVAPDRALVAFHRYDKIHDFIILMNMEKGSAKPSLDLEIVRKAIQEGPAYLEDVLTGEVFEVDKEAFKAEVPLGGFSTRWLLVQKKK